MTAAVALAEDCELPDVDVALRRAVTRLTRSDADFWSFCTDRRSCSPAYFQYPAMMVPTMQREILRVLLHLQPGVCSALDPFAGSGTILVEALHAGIDAHAQDINPLAVLLCKVKISNIRNTALRTATTAAAVRARADASRSIEAKFPTLRKWFRNSTLLELSRLRRSIRRVPDLAVRRFLWVALAETVRVTSNSRTSTYKLHIRPDHEISALPSAQLVFERVLERNLCDHAKFELDCHANGRAEHAAPRPRITISLRDSRRPFHRRYDLLVTSPPYGDNVSTVPYGQAAFLPLHWIDLEDIDAAATSDNLRTSHEVDRRSLGGQRTRRGDLSTHYLELLQQSDSLRRFFRRLRDLPRDRSSRVLAFAKDLADSVAAATRAINVNGYLLWTVGNRWVGGMEFPLAQILSELLVGAGAIPVLTIRRRIHQKRMPFRNATSKTMRRESVLVFRQLPRAV